MKKSKYILSILLTLAFVFTAACGTGTSTTDDEDVDLEADVDVATEDSQGTTEADELDEELLEDSEESGDEYSNQAAVDDAKDAAIDVADSDIPEDLAMNDAVDPEAPGSFPDTSLDSVPDPSAPADNFASAPGGGFADGFNSGGGSGEYETYSVQKGDTLMKIAFKVYGDLTRWREIYSQNQARIPNPNMLVTGTSISYERPSNNFTRNTSGRSYLIQQGDTLGSIAVDVYARMSKWRKIWDRNRDLIKDPNKIYAGFLLYYDITPEELAEAENRRNNMNQEAQQQMNGQDQFVEQQQMPVEEPMMEEPTSPQGMEAPPQANNELPQEVPAGDDEFGEIRLPAAE